MFSRVILPNLAVVGYSHPEGSLLLWVLSSIVYTSSFYSSSTSPRLSPSIRAEWLPNCIARFFWLLASTSPSLREASLSNILSPTPTSTLGSILKCTGKADKNDTTLSDRNGCLVSFPCEEMTRSSLPKFRVGIRSISSCNYFFFSIIEDGILFLLTSEMTAGQPPAWNTDRWRP